MATLLTTFAPSEIRVVRKETLLTEGLNLKEAAVTQRGIYRGFKIQTHATPLTVTVSPDADANDHVAVYETATGYSLRLRKSGGSFSLDLTTKASTTVVIAIYGTYTTGTITSAEIRAYELSPVDEFTVAPERGELLVLGEVDVPAAGVIPSTALKEFYRVNAWEAIAVGVRGACQIIKNGDFMLCSDDAPTTGEILWPCWDYSDVIQTNCSFRVVTTGTPKVGYYHLALTTTGVAGQEGILPYEGIYRVRGGERVKAAVWLKRLGTVAPGVNGHMGLRLRVYGDNPTIPVATYYLDDLVIGTSYTETMGGFRLPSTARWLAVDVYFDDDNAASSGTLYFDDVRVWIEQPDVSDGDVEGWLPLHHPAITTRSIDIAPMPGSYANLEDFLNYVLTLRHDTSNEFVLQRRRDIGDFLLKLVNGGLEINNLIEDLGSSRIGSAAEGAQARITSQIAASATTPYVLLWEIDNSSGTGGNLRIYATDNSVPSTVRNALAITSNAEWTGTGWQYDDSGNPAGRFDFTALGFYCYFKEASGTSPWSDTDWDDLSEAWPLFRFYRTRAGAGLVSTYAALNMLLSGTPTETDLETGRITVDVGDTSTSRRTAVMDIKSVLSSAFSHARLYEWIDGSTNVLEWIINGKWNETDADYDKDDTGSPASLMYLNESADFAISRSLGTTNPFDDFDWVDMFKVASQSDDAAYLSALDGRLDFNAATVTYSNREVPAVDNALYAANIPKAWAKFKVASGAVTYLAEFGITSVVVSSPTVLTITLDRPMSTDEYCATASCGGGEDYAVGVESSTVSTMLLTAYDISAGIFRDFTTSPVITINLTVFGRQG